MDFPGHVRKKASTEISFAEYGKPHSDDEEPTKENKRVIDLIDPLDAMSLNNEQTRVVVAGMRGVLQIIKILKSDEDITEGPSIVKDVDLRTRARGKINILYSANNVSWNKTLDQNVATTSSNGSIVVWNVSRKNKIIYKSHERSATCLDWNAEDPHVLISGSRDCHVYSYDIRTPDQHQQVFVEGTCEAVRDLEFVKHPGFQKYFFTGDDSGALRLWDLRMNKKWVLQRTAHNSFVSTISLNPNERNLLATGGGRDKLIKVWDWSKDKIERRYVVETMAPLGRCMWRPDRPYQIATCASVNDMNVHVWDIRRPFIPYATYDEHRDSVTDACWPSAGTECFMSCGKDGLIVLHAIDSGHAPISYACDVPFDVTPDGIMGIAVNTELQSKIMAEMEPLPIAATSRSANSNRSLMVRQQKMKKIAYEMFRGPIKSIVTCGIPDTLQISLPPTAFHELARKYWLGGRALRVICRHNSKASKAVGKDHVAQTWRLVEALIAQANLQEIYDEDAAEWKKDFEKKWAVMKKELASEGKRILPNIHELNKASLARINADRLESTSMVNEYLQQSDNESDQAGSNQSRSETEESDNFDSDNSDQMNLFRHRRKKKKKARQRTSSSADFYFGGGESNFRVDSKKKENLHLNEFMGLRDEAFELRFKNKKLFCDANKSVEDDDFTWSPMMEILRLLQYHSEQGDVQTCASVAIVCGRKLFDVIDTYTVGAWIDSYMEMCDRLELYVTNARIKKYCAIHRINQMSREGTNIELVHSECEKPIKNGRCTKCEKIAAPMCTACHEPVTGLMSECHICRHVMHPQHAMKWFKDNRYCCATDCLCPCPKSEYPYVDRYYLEPDDIPIDFTEFYNRPKRYGKAKRGDISKLRIHAVDYRTDSDEGGRVLELTPEQREMVKKYKKVPEPSETVKNAIEVMLELKAEERKRRKIERKNYMKQIYEEEEESEMTDFDYEDELESIESIEMDSSDEISSGSGGSINGSEEYYDEEDEEEEGSEDDGEGSDYENQLKEEKEAIGKLRVVFDKDGEEDVNVEEDESEDEERGSEEGSHKSKREKKVYPSVTSTGEHINENIRDLIDSSESEIDEEEEEEVEVEVEQPIQDDSNDQETNEEVECDEEAIEDEEYGNDAELEHLEDIKRQYCMQYIEQAHEEMENEEEGRNVESGCSNEEDDVDKEQLVSEEDEELNRLICKSRGSDLGLDRVPSHPYVNEDHLLYSESITSLTNSTNSDNTFIRDTFLERSDVDSVALLKDLEEEFEKFSEEESANDEDEEEEEVICHTGQLGSNKEGVPFSETRNYWPLKCDMQDLADAWQEKKYAERNEFLHVKESDSMHCLRQTLDAMEPYQSIDEEAREDMELTEEFVKVYYFIPWKELLKPGAEVMLRDVYDMCARFKTAKRRTCNTHYYDFLFKFYASSLATRIRGLWFRGINNRTNESLVYSTDPQVRANKIMQFENSVSYNFPVDWATLKPCCRSLDDNDDFEDLLDLEASEEKEWTTEERGYVKQYWNYFGKVPIEVKTTNETPVTVIGSKPFIKMDGSKVDLLENEKYWARKRIMKMRNMKLRRPMMRYKPVRKAEWMKDEKDEIRKEIEMGKRRSRMKREEDMEKMREKYERIHTEGVIQHKTQQFMDANPQEDWTGAEIQIENNVFISYRGNSKWPIVRIYGPERVVDLQPVVPKFIVQLRTRLRKKLSTRMTYKIPITDQIYGESVTHTQKKRDYKSKHIQRSENFDYSSYVRQSGPFKKFVTKFTDDNAQNLYHQVLEYDEAADHFVYKRILGTIVEETEQQLFWNMVKMKAKGDTRVIDEKLEKIDYEIKKRHRESEEKKYRDYIKDEKRQDTDRWNLMRGTWLPKFNQKMVVAKRALQKAKLLIDKDVHKWMVFEYHMHENRRKKAIKRRKERALRRKKNVFGIDLKGGNTKNMEEMNESFEEYIECSSVKKKKKNKKRSPEKKFENYDSDTDTSEGTIPTSPDDDQSVSSWFDDEEEHVGERVAADNYVDEMRILAERTKGAAQDKHVLHRYYWNNEERTSDNLDTLTKKEKHQVYRQADSVEDKRLAARNERKIKRTELYQEMKQYYESIGEKESIDRHDPMIRRFICELHREELRRVGNRLKMEMRSDYRIEQDLQNLYDCLLPRYITDSEYTELVDITFGPCYKYQELFEALVIARRMVVPLERYESIFANLGVYSIQEISEELIECNKTREAICWMIRNEEFPDTMEPREWIKRRLNTIWPASHGKLDEFKRMHTDFLKNKSSRFFNKSTLNLDIGSSKKVKVEITDRVADILVVSDVINDILSRVEEYIFDMDYLMEQADTSKDCTILNSIQYHDYVALKHLNEEDIDDLKEKKDEIEEENKGNGMIEVETAPEVKCQFKIGSYESEPSIVMSEGFLRKKVEEKKEIMTDIESEEGSGSSGDSSCMEGPSNGERKPRKKKLTKKLEDGCSRSKYSNPISKQYQRVINHYAEEPEELIIEKSDISTDLETDSDENEIKLENMRKNGKWVEFFEGDEEMNIDDVMERFGVPLNTNMKYYTFEFHKFDKVVFGTGDVEKIRKQVEHYVEEYEDSDGIVYEEEAELSEGSNSDAMSYKSMKNVMNHEIYFQREVPEYRVPSCVVMFNPNQFFNFRGENHRFETERWQRIIELTNHPAIFTILAMRERLIKTCRNTFYDEVFERYGAAESMKRTVDRFKNCLIGIVVDTKMKPWMVNIMTTQKIKGAYQPNTKEQYLRAKMLKESRKSFFEWIDICRIDKEVLSLCPIIEVDDKQIDLRTFRAMQDSVIHDEVVDKWHILTKEQGIRALDSMIQMKATPPAKLPLMEKIFKPIYDAWYDDWNVWRKEQNGNVVYEEEPDPVVVAEYQFKLVSNYAYQYYRMIKYDPVLSKTKCKDFSIRFPTFRQDVPSSALLTALRQSILEFINVGSKPMSEERRRVAKNTIINIAHHGNPNDPKMYHRTKSYDDDEVLTMGGSVDDLRSTTNPPASPSDADNPECFDEILWLRSKHEARDMHRRRFMAQMLFEITQRTLYRTCPQLANFTMAQEKFEQLWTKHAVQRPLLDMMLTKIDGVAQMSDEEKKFLLEHKLLSEEDLNEPDSDEEQYDEDAFEEDSDDSDEEESETESDEEDEEDDNCFEDEDYEDADTSILKVSFIDENDEDITFVGSRDGSSTAAEKIEMFTPSITREAQPPATYPSASPSTQSSSSPGPSSSPVEQQSSSSPSSSTLATVVPNEVLKELENDSLSESESDEDDEEEEEEEELDEKLVMGKKLWERRMLLSRHFSAIASLDKRKIEERLGEKLGKKKMDRLTEVIRKNCDTAHESWGPVVQMVSRKRKSQEKTMAERKRMLEEQIKLEEENKKRKGGPIRKYDPTNPNENGISWSGTRSTTQ